MTATTATPTYTIAKPSNANLNPGKDGVKKAATILLQTVGLLGDCNTPELQQAYQALLAAVFALETAQSIPDNKRRVKVATPYVPPAIVTADFQAMLNSLITPQAMP